MRLERWRITGYVFVWMILLAIVIFALQGMTEDAVRTYLRTSARTSVILFMLAFSASSLQHFFTYPWTTWLRRNRRYLGVSFALAHGLHLLSIILLFTYFPHPFRDYLTTTTLIGGGLAYVFILLMTITSFSPAKQWLGKTAWNVLHTVGSYYIWIIFMQSYFFRALKGGLAIPFAVALFGVLMLRVARRLGNRSNVNNATA